MTPTALADPALPNLPLLFDGEAMRELLTRRIEGAAGGEIVSCRPNYVRYKPGTSCLVAYDLVVQIDGHKHTRLAHVRVFADDRGHRRITKKKMRRLVDRASEACGDPSLDWATYLPEVNGIFSIFPIDYDLRPLLDLAVPSLAQDRLRQLMYSPKLTLARSPELIRYKPGRKALLRYEMEGGVVYGKVHADDRGDTIRQATDTLIAAGLSTPPVLGTIPKLRFIAHAEAPGAPLAAMRDDPHYVDTLAAFAEPLARLHRTSIDGLPVHRLTDEADRIHETATLLGVILPDQRDRLQKIAGTISAGLSRVDVELATGHGDFYDDQAMVDDGRIALIDLDEIRLAHPLLDIGNMLAHLRAGEMRSTVPPGSGQAFTDAMRQYRKINDDELALFVAIGVLKLAPGPFRRLEPDWPKAIGDLLDLVEALLGEYPTPVVPAGSTESSDPDTSPIRDEKLPELPTLQDPARMQSYLRETTGDHGLELTGVHVQRHKLGRRAILRYDVADSEPIWGKIFASKRGPRVHRITRAICDARAFGPDVALPDPVGYVPDLRLLLQRAVPGEVIEPRLLAGETVLADRIAEAIHALHASGLDLGRQHDLEAELAPLPQRVTEVSELFPALRDVAESALNGVLEQAETIQGWRFLPIHRDFYHQQVLADGDRLSILDLDDAKMSEPAVDIANFAAHLELLALQHQDHQAAVNRVRDRFLARSRELDPALDDRLLAFLTASTLVRLSGIHAPRADGERIAAALLAGAHEALELSVAGFAP